jgi:hypothetical protein
LGNGGGIITKKLLFAVLLIASLTLSGIATASAAEAGTTQNQTSDTNTLTKDVKTQSKSGNISKYSTKTQKMVNKSVKTDKKDNYKKTVSTQNKNSQKIATQIKNEVVKHVNTEVKSISKNTQTQKTAQNRLIVTKSNDVEVSTTVPVTTESFAVSSDDKAQVTNINTTTETTAKPINTTISTNKLQAAAGDSAKTITQTVAPKSTATSVAIPADLKSYILATANCQVNDASINSLAWSLARGGNGLNEATNIFNWVRNNIGYSFYYNTKHGAVGTLNAGTGNCVDTAHLLIALSRAAGIPARYVHANARFTSGNVYGHVWAEIWVNGKWYTADASSNYNSFGVVKSWTSATIKGTYTSLPF